MQLRAGDQDRQRVADQLKTAVDEGRLTLDEYDERLGATYAAKTYRDLAGITADLPRSAPEAGSSLATSEQIAEATNTEARRRQMARRYRWSPWRPWLAASMITTVIWLLTGLDEDGFGYFWPMWVIVPWGLVLASQTVGSGGRRHRRRC